MSIQIRRIYDEARDTDGYRVLVDRLWPRGVAREDAEINAWVPEIAPSTALRKWFSHDPAKWEEFQTRYREELAAMPDGEQAALRELAAQAKYEAITLLYATRDTEHNHAMVLADYLYGMMNADG